MHDLIATSYSEQEAEAFSKFTLSKEHEKAILDYGKGVLSFVPPAPFLCTYMSALWGAAVRDKTAIPTHVVAGNLVIDGKKVFYGEDRESIKHAFTSPNLSWEGHVWVNFAGKIGGISLFRTAYSHEKGHWLHDLIIESFGEGKGFLFGSIPKNLIYDPLYVLTDAEITGLVFSSSKLFTRRC
jgi:hypothetical protein